eukprot:137753_1
MKSSRLFMLGLVLLLSGTSVFGMDGGYYDYDGSDDIVGSYQNVYANFVDDLENEQGAVNMSDESPKRSLPRTIVNYVLTIAVLALSVCIAWCLAKGAIKIALKLVLVVVVVLVVAGLLGSFSPTMKEAVSDRVKNGVQLGAKLGAYKMGEVLRNPKDALNTVAHTANEMKGKTIKICKGLHCAVDAVTSHYID